MKKNVIILSLLFLVLLSISVFAGNYVNKTFDFDIGSYSYSSGSIGVCGASTEISQITNFDVHVCDWETFGGTITNSSITLDNSAKSSKVNFVSGIEGITWIINLSDDGEYYLVNNTRIIFDLDCTTSTPASADNKASSGFIKDIIGSEILPSNFDRNAEFKTKSSSASHCRLSEFEGNCINGFKRFNFTLRDMKIGDTSCSFDNSQVRYFMLSTEFNGVDSQYLDNVKIQNLFNGQNLLPEFNISTQVTSVCLEDENKAVTFNYTINVNDIENDNILYATQNLKQNINSTILYYDESCSIFGCSYVRDYSFYDNVYFKPTSCQIETIGVYDSTKHNLIENGIPSESWEDIFGLSQVENEYVLSLDSSCGNDAEYIYQLPQTLDKMFYFTQIKQPHDLTATNEAFIFTMYDNLFNPIDSIKFLYNLSNDKYVILEGYLSNNSLIEDTGITDLASSNFKYEETIGIVSDSGNNGFDLLSSIGMDRTRMGINGNSYNFNALSNFLYASNNDEFSYNNMGLTDKPFSVSTWIYINNSPTLNSFIGKYNSSGSQLEWLFFINNVPNDALAVTFNDNSQNAYIRKTSIKTIPHRQWVHVGFTYDGSSTENGIKLYMNGEKLLTSSQSAGVYIAMENTTSKLNIGMHRGLVSNVFFNGSIDETQIYDFVLSDEQMLNLGVLSIPPIDYRKIGQFDATAKPVRFSIQQYNNQSVNYLTLYVPVSSSFVNLTSIPFNSILEDSNVKYLGLNVQNGIIFQNGFMYTGTSLNPIFSLNKPNNVTFSDFNKHQLEVFVTDNIHPTEYIKKTVAFNIIDNQFCVNNDIKEDIFTSCSFDIGNNPSIFKTIFFFFRLPFLLLCLFGLSWIAQIIGLLIILYTSYRYFTTSDLPTFKGVIFLILAESTLLFIMSFLSIPIYILIILISGLIIGSSIINGE